MKRFLMLLTVAMLLSGLSGRAIATSPYFTDGHLIRAVYQTGGQYEVLTDLGPFTPTAPYSGANLSLTSNPFPVAGSGAFSSATWAKLQVAYFVKTANNVWTSGPVAGQKINSNHFDAFQSAADTVYAGALNFAAGTANAQVKQSDIQSYISIMDNGDPAIGAGYFAGFIPALNGEQNLADLGSGSSYVDSYLYYYATPDSKSSGLQVADIRTYSDGHTEIVAVTAAATHTLTVSKTGTGSGTVGGGGTFDTGTSHDITATASAGSTFTGWSGDCTGTASPLTVLVDKDKTCTATFTLNQVTQYTLTVNTSGTGSGTIGGGGTYNSGTSHDITATASAGSTFTVWSGDCTGTASPLSVVVDKAKTCTATFTLSQATQFALTVNKTGTGNGTVGGGGTYNYGTSHDITAAASAGSTFTEWSGDCTGTASPLTVLVDKAKTCTATFTLNQVIQYALTLNKAGTGSGNVTGGGIYDSGTSHDITATASTGSTFTGWSGDCTGTASPLTVLVDKAKTCIATFTLNQVTQYALTVNKSGTGSGNVTGGGTYDSGTSHDITAAASAGSTFTEWSGDCTGTASPLTVLVDKAKTCIATFTLNQVTQYALTVNKSGTGSGNVTGGGTYDSGTSHDITATASTGSTFTGWSGDCTGTASTLSVLVDKAKTCTAIFTLDQYVVISLTTGWNLFGWISKTGYYAGTPPAEDDYASGAAFREVADLGDAMNAIGVTDENYAAVIGPGGKVYVPGSPFNTLTGLMPGMAYWVYMNEGADIKLPGDLLSDGTAITMAGGWIQAAYLGVDGATPSNGFAVIGGLYDAIVNGSGEIYIPGSFFNTLNKVNQSEGYFIHATGAGTLKYSSATHFAVSAPVLATAGTGFNFIVTALDVDNNPVADYAGTVHFTGTDDSASLPEDTTLINGTGTFSAILNTAGSRKITATDTATAIKGTSNAIAVGAATATHFAVSAPVSAIAGTSFNFIVTALDAFNNVDTGYKGTVHFTTPDDSAPLPANRTLTKGTGKFQTTLMTTGIQTITAIDTVISSLSGTSNSVTTLIQQTGSPTFSLSPTSLSFGSIKAGTISVVKSVIIKNNGTRDLNTGSISIAGTDAAAFTWSGNCVNVSPKGSCELLVTFNASAPFVQKTAVLNILSNDFKKLTATVKLTGTTAAPVMSVSPTSINFGNIQADSASTKTITIKNTGVSDLTISEISITGTNAAEFSQTNNCTSIPAKGSCTVSITMSPAAAGSKAAQLSIISDDPKKTSMSVNLTGTGQ